MIIGIVCDFNGYLEIDFPWVLHMLKNTIN